MSETGLLDTLVKLASLGTSGICIFVIFWIGWLLSKPAAPHSAQRERTLRLFMAICVVIALVSGGSAILGNERDKKELRDKITSLTDDVTSLRAEVDERDEPYSVKGVVQLDDGREPSNVGITVGYPPSPPEDQYGNFHLSIWKTGRRDLPALTVNCPGYRIRGVNLSDPKLATITDRNIEVSKIVLARIPK